MTRRTVLGEVSLTGSEASCDQLYWNRASDLLFAVRPLGAGGFAYEAINPAFEAALGISSRKIRKLDVFDYMGAEDARLICSAFQACLAQGSEVRVRHGLAFGGSRHDTETTAVPVIQPDGCVRLIGTGSCAGRMTFVGMLALLPFRRTSISGSHPSSMTPRAST